MGTRYLDDKEERSQWKWETKWGERLCDFSIAAATAASLVIPLGKQVGVNEASLRP